MLQECLSELIFNQLAFSKVLMDNVRDRYLPWTYRPGYYDSGPVILAE